MCYTESREEEEVSGILSVFAVLPFTVGFAVTLSYIHRCVGMSCALTNDSKSTVLKECQEAMP